MANVELPINPLIPKQNLDVLLSKKRYKINARWNTRDESWYMGLSTIANKVIFPPVKVLPGWIPFRQLLNPIAPIGRFFVTDTITENVPPGKFDLGIGARVRINYIDETV
jgi:hypothetical protein